MTAFTLIWGAFMRRKARTIFTFLSVMVAFMLFCVLAALRQGMLGQITISSAEQLQTYSKQLPGSPFLPLSYYKQIVAVPGVATATYFTGFQGYFNGPKNQVQVTLTAPKAFLDVYREEITLPSLQESNWVVDRLGAIASSLLAKRMGWKVGDTVPLQSRVPQKDGTTTWYFHLDGIYQTNLPESFQNNFYAHYDYINEGIALAAYKNLVLEYVERVDDPRHADRTAIAIDKLFENSNPQTQTNSQLADAVSYVRQFGDVSAMTIYVGLAVFFSLLLIIANAIAQSVRERTAEFALLRVLGFNRLYLVWLVAQESLLLMVTGSIIGLIVGYGITRLLYFHLVSIFTTFDLTWSAVGAGIFLSIVIGLLATVVPVRWVTHLGVSDTLCKA